MKLLILMAFVFLGVNAQAIEKVRPQIYGYNYWIPKIATDFLNRLDQDTELESHIEKNKSTNNTMGDLQCLPIFKNIIKNRSLDIRYALGYFDDSQAKDILYDGFNYGLSPSLDIEAYHALRNVFKAPCHSITQKLCGFQEVGDPLSGQILLAKIITLWGVKVLAQITLTYASASDSYVANTTTLSELQKKLTLQSEKNFFDHVGLSDVVIYNGHARDGGGPDFSPPILNKELHVDYDGYYHLKKTGFTRILNQIEKNKDKDSSIQNNKDKKSILGIFACSSKKHFYKDLISANKNQPMVLSTDKVNYIDSLRASLGLLEGLMRGQCGDHLNTMIQQKDKSLKTYEAFQIK